MDWFRIFCRTIFALTVLAGCSSSDGTSDYSQLDPDDQVAFLSSFDYQPAKPVGGKLLGIIELGYTGFNSFTVRMDNQDRWVLEKAVYGESYISDGAITFEHVMNKIDQFKAEMITYGVSRNNINFVASSSAIKNDRVIEIADRLRQLNIGIITVNADQEGNYALQATVPPDLYAHAFMVDVGSGNTKVTWIKDGKAQTIETYGSKYYEEGISDEEAFKSIREALIRVPAQNKQICFMVGKVPYTLATATNNRNGRYTILESPTSYKLREEQELAGLNIYKALYEESTISHVFDWDSNFSIGVLMTVN